MSDFRYDAFISYRHAEKDTLIASEIQKSLERFKIPKALRKKSGKERFNRVFRDVEELPITSNLTEDLEEALKSSEYLIVICSFRTSESTWVKREIEKFLEFHDYNKQLILTVLVEGEPDEVIPEELRHDNITHYLADGTFYCKDEVVEPLAADYRMPLSKARKVELPRLAASMLGCKYDEIIRRRKAYKRTRLLIETALVCAAAIALMVYVGWTFMRIQDALNKSQVNQARYLSSESQKLLDDGDRIGAIQLALAAFEDSSGNRRPITSDALFALSSALGAYSTEGRSRSVPVWRYETPAEIISYECTENGDLVLALDATGSLHIWKRNDSKEQILKDDDYRLVAFTLDKNGNIIVFNSKYVASYDPATLAEKWKTEHEGYVAGGRSQYIEYYPQKGYVVLNCNASIIIVNAEDGKIVKKLDTHDNEVFTKKSKRESDVFSTYRFLVNDDFSRLAVIGTLGGDYRTFLMFVCDIENEKWTCVTEGSGDYLDAVFDSDGNIIVLRRTNDDINAAYQASIDRIYDATVILEQINTSGRTTWSSTFPSINRIINIKLISADYKTAEGNTLPVIYAAYSNRLLIVDKSNGKLIKSFDLPDSIVRTSSTKQYVTHILRNGTAVWIPRDGSVKRIQTSKYFMAGTMGMSPFSDGKSTSYLVEDSTKRIITEYSGNFSDSKYIEFENSASVDVPDYSIRCGDYLLTYNDDTDKFTGTDLKNKKVLWTKDAPKRDFYFFDNAASPDNLFVYLLDKTVTDDNDAIFKLFKINCANGQIADANSEFSVSNMTYLSVTNGKIWAKTYEVNTHTVTLVCYDMNDDSLKKTTVDINEFPDTKPMSRMRASNDAKKALIYLETNGITDIKYYRLNVDTATGKYTKAECGECIYSVWNEKGTLFAEIYREGNIKVFSASGEEKFSKVIEQRVPRNMVFHDDKLYVFYDTDEICCYDTQGNQTMSINLGHGDMGSDDHVYFEFVHGLLFVTAGENTDVINLSDNKVISSFAGFLCLYGVTNSDTQLNDAIVVCKANDNINSGAIGFFNYKTPERLIEQAKEYLKEHGVTMTEDFKRKYGLQ